MSSDAGRPDLPLVGLFNLAYNRLSEGIFAEAAKGEPDLRPAHGNVLQQLDMEDGLRLTEIAKRSGITPQSAGELVDQLERMGIVERRADPDDRRAKRIYLTARGKKPSAAAMRMVQRQERDIREHLGDRRYRELRGSLERVLAIAQKYLRDPPQGAGHS